MKLSFVKMHGAGNDFVMVDDRAETFPVDDASFIAKLANRPDGVGCEGVILVRPVKADATIKGDATSKGSETKGDATSKGSETKGDATFLSRENKNSPAAAFAMRFFNPDGSEADLCGNGARCVAAFALAIGAAPSRTMRFETRAGTVSAEVLDDGRVRIGMPQPKDLRKDFVNSGVPHAIVPVEDLAAADVAGEGRRIRHSEAFAPAGTNVDFVKWTGEHSLSIRTYERGVEAETFACGTGSVASALVGVAQYGLRFPVTVKTACGYELEIGGAWNGESFSDVTLTGPVKTVFAGEIEI